MYTRQVWKMERCPDEDKHMDRTLNKDVEGS
jgi:hypothetical protein